MEQPYSNREILEKFTDIKETLARIEKQTTKTNGRVTELEKEDANVRGKITVTAVVATMVFTVIIMYIGWVSLQIESLSQHQAVLISQVHIK